MMTRRDLVAAAAAALSPASAAISSLLRRTEPATWVLTGDSITHGAKHTFGSRSYPEHIAERLRWEMHRVRDIVINTGVSGDRISRMLPEIDQRVLRFRPDLVSLKFGMNDCVAGQAGRGVFRDALAATVDKIKATGAVIVLHTPNLIYYPADPARQDLPAYVAIIREFAAAHPDVLLVDHYEHWERTRTPAYKLLALLADGAIHPNAQGHVLLAHLMLREMGMFDAESSTGRLFVPYGSLRALS